VNVLQDGIFEDVHSRHSRVNRDWDYPKSYCLQLD